MQYEITVLERRTTPLGEYLYVNWEGYAPQHNIWISKDAINDNNTTNPHNKEEDGTEIETSTHISPDLILNCIATHRKSNAYKCENIIISQFIGQKLRNYEIAIWLRNNHYIVLANYNNSCLVADGVNTCMGDQNIDAEIRLTQGKTMKRRYIGYQFQTHQGTCGASATLIALEMIRIIKSGLPILDRIEPTPKLRKIINKQLHKGKGNEDRAQDETGKAINLRSEQRKRCLFCNKYIIKRAILLKHEAICKNKR